MFAIVLSAIIKRGYFDVVQRGSAMKRVLKCRCSEVTYIVVEKNGLLFFYLCNCCLTQQYPLVPYDFGSLFENNSNVND